MKQHRVLFGIVGLTTTLVVAGCSSSATSTETSSTAPPPISTTSTPSTSQSSSNQNADPELVVCVNDNFYAVPSNSSAIISTPLVAGPTGSFGEAAAGGRCSGLTVSPSLSRWAEVDTVSNNSTDAGYVSAGGSSFVDLTTQASNYADNTIKASNPVFDPVTGDLWWSQQAVSNDSYVENLWHVPSSGGTPVQYGPGSIAGFSASGDPLPVPLLRSPSGNTVAFFLDGWYSQYGSGFLVFGTPQQLSSQCLEPDYETNGNTGGYVPSCPGTSTINGNFDCPFILGLSDDSTAICENGSSQYVRIALGPIATVPCSGIGRGTSCMVSTGAVTSLTPTTNQQLTSLGLAPDGSTIWYSAKNSSGTLTLYEVSATTPTTNPAAFTPMVEDAGQTYPVTSTQPVGWILHGKFVPGELPLGP